MAVTSKSMTQPAGETQPPADPAPTADSERERAPKAKTSDDREARIARSECVVDDGTAHMGRALPGKLICSAHEMHYLADGTPRAERV